MTNTDKTPASAEPNKDSVVIFDNTLRED